MSYTHSNNNTCISAISIFNAVAENFPPSPIMLKEELPHIMAKISKLGDDNLVTQVEVFVDIGAAPLLAICATLKGWCP